MKYQLPNLLGNEIGLLLASLLIVAIMASSMSTADSNLHALGALVTRDVYDRFLRPQSTEKERLWVGRFVILAASVLSLLVVLSGSRQDSSLIGFMEMMVGLGLFGVAFSVQLLPITIDVLFVRKGTSVAACAGLAIGVVFAFMFTSLFAPLVEWVGFPPLRSFASFIGWVKSALPVHASVWGLVPNTIVLVLISTFTKPVSEEIRLRFANDVGM
jgi:Na+/proline symporter